MLSVFHAEEWENYGLMTVDSSLIYSIVDVLLGGRRGSSAMRIEGRPYTTIERTLVQRKTAKPFYIDKLPNNWLYAGFIAAILPNAKIIDPRRHPLETRRPRPRPRPSRCPRMSAGCSATCTPTACRATRR